MVFFLPLRQSITNPGTIEPDIMPTSASSEASQTQTPLTAGRIVLKSPIPTVETSTFREYITRWDLSDQPAVLRKIVCILAVLLHTPQNLISIFAHGISIMFFVWVLLSMLNLFCVGIAMWNLDTMRGDRLVYNKIYKRHNFDYVILGLFLIYGSWAGVFIYARITHWVGVLLFRIGWPCLILADLFCFIVGWIATWRDVSVAPLGY